MHFNFMFTDLSVYLKPIAISSLFLDISLPYSYIMAVAILPLTAIYPQRLFYRELFVIGQSK